MGMLRMSNFSRSNKQAAAYSSPPKAQREAIHGPLQTPSKQKQLAPSAPQSGSTHVEQQGHMQPALPPVKLAPIRTKPAMKKSLFARVRRAQHFRAGKAYNVKRTGLNVDVNAQEQPQIIYDLQQPLIV